MSSEEVLAKHYDPAAVEGEIYRGWEESGAFRSHPDDRPREQTFTIVIPPPNVTGALHLGHALNNTLQDILVRYHRMRGFNTLWQPGTDHAGIATQAVVERRIREQDNLTRHQLGREELVKRIWAWKDEYEARIISQLKLMGCSCDWERKRFTLDDGLARAVRHQFFKLFKDGLIFRGKRLVNWDTQLQTAVSDDEVYHETVKGHFWHFKYPVISPKSGEPAHVIIATTRPETMLGDTAVAVHPDPEGFFDRAESELKSMRDRLADRSSKEANGIQAKLDALTELRESHLAELIQLRDMARDGRMLMLPLVERKIPLITDKWADPTKGSGRVKITPAHDPNDYEVGLRHELPMINVLTEEGKVARIVEPNGEVNSHSEKYEGLTFIGAGRDKVVADMDALDLLHEKEDRAIEIGYSERSKVPIEPFLSDQWFLQTSDRDITLGDGKSAPGLAQAAIDVVDDGRIHIHPARYAKSYRDWLQEKRDWCISRQLWWGHRITVWRIPLKTAHWADPSQSSQHSQKEHEQEAIAELRSYLELAGVIDNVEWSRSFWNEYIEERYARVTDVLALTPEAETVLANLLTPGPGNRLGHEKEAQVTRLDGFFDSVKQDVLDTWFSSALWPFSTLGWPEKTDHLKQYYPGTVLCTSRDIITNWVARMVMFGLYAMGDVPFDHVYIHPKILDGRGETMSKSKGNGVDPVDIIHTHGADALRYTMADMTTETQDIRMPVEYVCPHCGKMTDQAIVLKREEQSRKSRGEKLNNKLQPADCLQVQCANKECGKQFATQWASAATKEELGQARETSEKFEVGRNFCNKLWNAARFAFMNLEGAPCEELNFRALPPEDRWILARLSQTIRRYHECIARYQFAASVTVLREFFWDALCDWYIELTKPRISAEPQSSAYATSPDATSNPDPAKQVLAFCMDQVLRLWHPTIPFITERLWQQLNAIVPNRGLSGAIDLKCDDQLVLAPFPPVEGYPDLEDDAILTTFADLQSATRGVRDLRANCDVSPKEMVTVTVVVPDDHVSAFEAQAHIVRHMAGIGELHVSSGAKRPANAGSITIRNLRIYVHDISDDDAERERATKALGDVLKQIKGKESKLGNEKFVANAKPEIVQAERERLEVLIAQKTAMETQLAELSAD